MVRERTECDLQPASDGSRSRCDELLDGGLTEAEAVELAFLARADIRAPLARIDAAAADLAQAGLLRNPTLSASFLFADASSDDKFTMGLAFPLADLLTRTERRALASRVLDRTVADAARRVVDVAAEVRAAFRRAVALEEARVVADDSLQLSRRAEEIAERRVELGQISSYDLVSLRSAASAAQLAALEAARSAELSALDLARAVGHPVDPRATHPAVEPTTEEVPLPELSVLLRSARESRLDIAVARIEVEAAGAIVAREEASLLNELRVGGEYEEVDDSLLGPTLAIELPLFDRGEARRASARAGLAEVQARLDALLQRADAEVIAAATLAASGRKLLKHLRESALPDAGERAALAAKRLEAGETPVDEWLDAQRGQLEVRRAYAAALVEAAAAEAAVESAIGRRLPRVVEEPR